MSDLARLPPDAEPLSDIPALPFTLPDGAPLSAEERGWVVSVDDDIERRRSYADTRLSTIEKQVAVMKMYHRGMQINDIAVAIDIAPTVVYQIIRGSQRKALRRVGAQAEKEAQLHFTDAILNRIAEAMFPDEDEDGTTARINPKDVDAAMKVLRHRAELTGAKAPTSIKIAGIVEKTPSQEIVEAVDEYMRLADAIMEHGYGSGRAPERGDEDIVDAELVDNPVKAPPPPPPRAPWKELAPAEEPAADVVVTREEAVIRALRAPAPQPTREPTSWGHNIHDPLHEVDDHDL